MNQNDEPRKISGENLDAENSNSKITQYGLKSTSFKEIEFLDVLHELRDTCETNFVFFFGKHNVGKSAIIGSLLKSLRNGGTKGAFYLNNGEKIKKGSGIIKLGYEFADTALNILESKRFIPRTTKGDFMMINGRFEAKDAKKHEPLNITFLDMAGEDLESLDVSGSSKGQLPEHIEIYFKASNLPLLFILVVPHHKAREDDRLLAQFLDKIHGFSPKSKRTSTPHRRLAALILHH